ncbi:YfbU family protein [Vagococcus lutrae]|uniref:YfbU family protein n=1 Tax=Vagococcus lutrae TaxID=81947 RepID=UPI00200C9163|nr:YfbU family protein [Vagococcus lutrae]UQF37866.1 YfbU family protein [Vagococcus lutrae]
MQLTRIERQILFNQHKLLGILSKDKEDIKYHEMMQEVYYHGFESEYFEFGVYDNDGALLEEDGKLVYKIINMYDDLYYFWKTTEELKSNIDEHEVMFPGFDLNDSFEHKLYSFAKFLIDDLDRFHDTNDLYKSNKIRELNSHGAGPGVSGYKLMLEKYEEHNKNRIKRGIETSFTLDEMEDIIKYYE